VRRFFAIMSPRKPATPKSLRRQKSLTPTAVSHKHPRFGRFSPSPFEWRFAFFSKTLCGAKNREFD
jgi:hypothetical protein